MFYSHWKHCTRRKGVTITYFLNDTKKKLESLSILISARSLSLRILLASLTLLTLLPLAVRIKSPSFNPARLAGELGFILETKTPDFLGFL